MNSSQLNCILLLVFCVLCGHAWGKAVDLLDTELEEVGLVTEERGLQRERRGLEAEDAKSNSCVYKGEIFTINVTNVAEKFKRMNITNVPGNIAFLSLCSPTRCVFKANKTNSNTSKTAAGCLYVINDNFIYEMGRTSNTEWNIINSTFFSITFSGGYDGMSFKVNFVVDYYCVHREIIELTSFQRPKIEFTAYINPDEQYLHLNDDVAMKQSTKPSFPDPAEERGQDTEERRLKAELETEERELAAENIGRGTDFEAAKNNSCVYKDKAFTIDVRKLAKQFKGLNITDDKYIYFLSLCSPIKCAFNTNKTKLNATAAGCQYIPDGPQFYELGLTSNVEWRVMNITYFYAKFSGGDNSRSLQVNFKTDNYCVHREMIEFNGEHPFLNYEFTVYMKSDDEFVHLNDDIVL